MNANSALIAAFGPYAFAVALTLIIVICLTVGLGSWTALRLWGTPASVIENPRRRALVVVCLTVITPLIFLLPILFAILAPGLVEPVALGVLVLVGLSTLAGWLRQRRSH